MAQRGVLPLATRVASQTATGALQGGVQGAVGTTINGGDLAANAQQGALTGAIMGGTLGVPANAVKNYVRGTPVDEDLARLAQTAQQKYNIPIYGHQLSNSPMATGIARQLPSIPLSGAISDNQAQLGAFTRALTRTIGEDEPKLTTATMAKAATNIGARLDDAMARGKLDLNAHPALLQDFADIEKELDASALPDRQI
jgi:hypothetical protein